MRCWEGDSSSILGNNRESFAVWAVGRCAHCFFLPISSVESLEAYLSHENLDERNPSRVKLEHDEQSNGLRTAPDQIKCARANTGHIPTILEVATLRGSPCEKRLDKKKNSRLVGWLSAGITTVVSGNTYMQSSDTKPPSESFVAHGVQQ